MRNLAALSLACALLQTGCVYLPRTHEVYDDRCDAQQKRMALEREQLGIMTGCVNEGCALLLAAGGIVTAASAIVSGSIVVAGNFVYWLERNPRCGKS